MDAPSPDDFEEMRARGYEEATCAPAEARAKAVAALIAKIEAAFAGVVLGDGRGLQEAHAMDDYADEATCAKLRQTDEKLDWRHIPGAKLIALHASLSYFDADGMRFHLPAFMIAYLRQESWDDLRFQLTKVHKDDFGQQRYSSLSSAQRLAVAAYLEWMLQYEEDELFDDDRADLKHSLSEYWRA